MDLSNSKPERENSKSKTLILKDSSVRSIWTYLTASQPASQTDRQRQTDRQTETERDRGRENLS